MIIKKQNKKKTSIPKVYLIRLFRTNITIDIEREDPFHYSKGKCTENIFMQPRKLKITVMKVGSTPSKALMTPLITE